MTMRRVLVEAEPTGNGNDGEAIPFPACSPQPRTLERWWLDDVVTNPSPWPVFQGGDLASSLLGPQGMM